LSTTSDKPILPQTLEEWRAEALSFFEQTQALGISEAGWHNTAQLLEGCLATLAKELELLNTKAGWIGDEYKLENEGGVFEGSWAVPDYLLQRILSILANLPASVAAHDAEVARKAVEAFKAEMGAADDPQFSAELDEAVSRYRDQEREKLVAPFRNALFTEHEMRTHHHPGEYIPGHTSPYCWPCELLSPGEGVHLTSHEEDDDKFADRLGREMRKANDD
jgi:hypothetical protein